MGAVKGLVTRLRYLCPIVNLFDVKPPWQINIIRVGSSAVASEGYVAIRMLWVPVQVVGVLYGAG